MNTNPLYSIGELKELDDVSRVNDYLTVGWVLLGNHVVQDGDPGYLSQRAIYSIGWSRELGEPVHPSTDLRDTAEEDGPSMLV